MKHFYLLLFVFINLSWTGYSQQEISGVVTDPDGLPLGGVNISVKNSNQVGAVTDIDGNFLINAVQNDTLIFSYIGFKTQEVAVGNKNNFTVTLPQYPQDLKQPGPGILPLLLRLNILSMHSHSIYKTQNLHE